MGIEAIERLPTGAVTCNFSQDSFDLRVDHELTGRRYRLVRKCLQRDIDPALSSFRVRRNHVVLSLAKASRHQDQGEQQRDEGVEYDEEEDEVVDWVIGGTAGVADTPVSSGGRR